MVMGLWYLTIASGSILTAVVAWANQFQGVAYYAFFAALMLAAAVVFALARWYPAAPASRRGGRRRVAPSRGDPYGQHRALSTEPASTSPATSSASARSTGCARS